MKFPKNPVCPVCGDLPKLDDCHCGERTFIHPKSTCTCGTWWNFKRLLEKYKMYTLSVGGIEDLRHRLSRRLTYKIMSSEDYEESDVKLPLWMPEKDHKALENWKTTARATPESNSARRFRTTSPLTEQQDQ